MFDMYNRLIAHGVRRNLADRLDRLITVLLDHIDFFEFKDSRKSASRTAKVLSDQTQLVFDTLLTTECQKTMHKNEKNYLLYLEISQIIPMAETILDCDEKRDWKGAREAARKCREWIEGLQ
ncbi:hypothetical protein E2P81_ATG02476 [Venturia nashicola]|nr:hypothetical protein E2P81_ATG02476 [Venturia nashicola]